MQDTTPPDTMPLCIDRKTAAKISGMSLSWHRLQDAIGTGPPKLRLGAGLGRIRYPLDQFMEWLKGHTDPTRGPSALSPV